MWKVTNNIDVIYKPDDLVDVDIFHRAIYISIHHCSSQKQVYCSLTTATCFCVPVVTLGALATKNFTQLRSF